VACRGALRLTRARCVVRSRSARLLRGGSEAAEGDVGDEDEGVDGRAGPGRDGGEADRLLRV